MESSWRDLLGAIDLIEAELGRREQGPESTPAPGADGQHEPAQDVDPTAKALADVGADDALEATSEDLCEAHGNLHSLFAGLGREDIADGVPLLVRAHCTVRNELLKRGLDHADRTPFDGLQWLPRSVAESVVELSGRPTGAVESVDLGVMKAKTDEELQYTFGVVYKATNESEDPELDYHGEFVEAELLQKAQWAYVKSSDRNLYKQHGLTGFRPIGEWVDLVTWPLEEEVELSLPGGVTKKTKIPANSVWMGVLWNDEGWKLVKAGRIRGLSLGGFAKREPVTVKVLHE